MKIKENNVKVCICQGHAFIPVMISIIILWLVFLNLGFVACFAQGVAINTAGTEADPSSMLDVSSTDKGVLISRMSTAQRDAIASPAQGLLIYNTTTKCFEFYENNNWNTMGCTCTVPDIPVAIAGSGAMETQITANWNASTGATSYNLDLSTVSDFSSFVSGFNDLSVGAVTTYDVTGLTCNTTYYYRVRAVNSCGITGSSNTITYTTAACFACGSPFTDSRDSRSYNTVQIGSQCWMAQNLNYSTSGVYTPIATGQGGAGTQKYCYNNLESNCDTYGGLYEWTEMMNGSATCNGTGAPPNDKCATPVQGICPSGWHIPSHYEWTTMEKNVGSNPGAFLYNTTTTGWLGTDEGNNLKTVGNGSPPLWASPSAGTNNSGFSALPCGFTVSGSFFNIGNYGFWMSTTDSGTSAWVRFLDNSHSTVNRHTDAKAGGFSVRCLKDLF